MDPIVGGVIAGIGAVTGIVTSISDGRKAKRAEREVNRLMANRPQYERPDEANMSLGLNLARAGDVRMPGADAARDAAQLAASNAANIAAQGGDPFAAALAAQAQNDSTVRSIAQQEAGYGVQQQQMLAQSLGEAASYSDTEWQMNTYAPYADALMRAQNDQRDYRSSARAGLSQSINAISNVGLGMLAGQGSKGGQAAAGPDQATISAVAEYFASRNQKPG